MTHYSQFSCGISPQKVALRMLKIAASESDRCTSKTSHIKLLKFDKTESVVKKSRTPKQALEQMVTFTCLKWRQYPGQFLQTINFNARYFVWVLKQDWLRLNIQPISNTRIRYKIMHLEETLIWEWYQNIFRVCSSGSWRVNPQWNSSQPSRVQKHWQAIVSRAEYKWCCQYPCSRLWNALFGSGATGEHPHHCDETY